MPPRYLRRASPTRLKPCQERMVETCDAVPADQCCGVIPCTLCIEWETYVDGVSHGSAPFDGSAWVGTVAGIPFEARWEQTFFDQPEPDGVSNSVGMSFMRIDPGTYNMGSPGGESGRDADEDQISTTVGGFFIGKTEVTQAQYLAVRGLSPSHFSGSSRPVESVNFADALAFCTALNALPEEVEAGRIYRIPTEAEWEFACRAGTTTAYNFGASSGDLAANGWYAANSGAETHDVSLKPANDEGLTDCHGNVWEWTYNSRADGTEVQQVVRGGSWGSDVDDCRSASRDLVDETSRVNTIGFRVAMYQPPPPQVGVCEFVVDFGGEEVYRATCYEGASCRNPSGEVTASIGYDEGTLRWSVYEPRELALIDDPDTGCRDFFCGDCRCSCYSLCVDVREVVYGDFIDTYYGELADTAYSTCDPPVWAGTIGSFEISLALGRDEYGNCIVTPTVNGYEQEPVSVVGCSDMSGTVELEDGSSFTFRCKQCSCAEEIGDCICGRPMGETLTLLFASSNAPSTIHTVTLTYGQIDESGITCLPFSPGPFPGYSGRFDGTLAIPMGGSRTEGIDFRLMCECTNCTLCLYYRFDSTSPTWCVASVDRTDCDCPALLTVSDLADSGCDLWSYQIFDVTILEDSGNC